ncbi:acyl-CoA synthetase [Acuticoccus sp.]|uniref:acyl-CoA synthetase n=1 Tax=Acuticoccus sp. TaxID=1904378 RepID=UPI003B522391
MTGVDTSADAVPEEACHIGTHAAKTPDRTAIHFAPTGERLSFADVEALSNRAANLLRACGLRRGERCAVFMENRIELLPLFWGAQRSGLRVTAIATHLTTAEVAYILADSGAKALFTSARNADVVTEVEVPDLPAANRFMLGTPVGGFRDLSAALAEQPTTPIADQAEGVEMLYSSGTTGRPKGVLRPMPDVAFGTSSAGYNHWAKLYGVDEGTVYFHPAPLYHAAPLVCSLRVLRFGGSIVMVDRFDASRALKIIEEHRPTHSQWVPTHFVRLLRLPEAERAAADVSSLRIAIHAAAPCPIEVKRRMIAWWGPIIHEYYAGSEGNGYVCLDSHEWLKKPGSVGRAQVGRLRICDDEGDEVPVGTEGTVYFEGGPTFEYHNDPQKTAGSRNRHGWSTLGDVGHLDADGYLFLTDRKTFMIVSGGVNIYPAEIEGTLITHPKVEDVAVFGVPNEDFGEEVKAVVQPRPDHLGEAGLADELIGWCRGRLSRVKCPRSVDIVDALPRAENGKLYKKVLRDAYWPQGARRI